MEKLSIEIQILDDKAKMPNKQYISDAGFDLHSIQEYIIKPGEIYKICTGLSIAIPEGFAGLVLPRSGLSSKFGLTLINSPGLIDPGYRGELLVPLINHSKNNYKIKHQERIAQLLIIETPNIIFNTTKKLQESERKNNGFGSTGE
jgi:dUTP pyrophosphatase